jgi:hypothetical protein
MDIGSPDPGFKVEIDFNRKSYRQGETIIMIINSTRDCYMIVFNLFSNDSLMVVLPNVILKEILLSAGDTLTIPPQSAEWDLPVGLVQGEDEDSEALMITATRDDVPFALSRSMRDGLILMKDALLAINRCLVDIHADRRTEDISHYVIVN